jgi:hypothetical protein
MWFYNVTRVSEKYGETKHIHSKNPPDKLEFIGKEKVEMHTMNGLMV